MGMRSWLRVDDLPCALNAVKSAGLLATHASLFNVTRSEPEKLLPPDFVIVLTTPPWKRPYSAETLDVEVVVSAMASSMKRGLGVPRLLSMTWTPFTGKRLSNHWAPEIVNAPLVPFALC